MRHPGLRLAGALIYLALMAGCTFGCHVIAWLL